jgi:predicted nucleotide-binding protein (sugar kinase/HSP70/actin superfamily)
MSSLNINGTSDFDDFLKVYPHYRKVTDNDVAKKIFSFLSEPENIFEMVKAIDSGKPAISGIVEELYNRYSYQNEYNLRDDMAKQSIGAMVCTILTPFGYKVLRHNRLSKDLQKYVTSSAVYIKSDDARVKLVQKITIEPV